MSNWQSTLFYWSGDIDLKKKGSSGAARTGTENDNSNEVVWQGKIVPLPNCEDARRGATPLQEIFRSSPFGFSLKSDLVGKETIFDGNDAFVLSFSSSNDGGDYGFDIAGERGDNQQTQQREGKKRKQPGSVKVQDKEHKILFSRGWRWRLAFGIGHNQYGSFLEVGFFSTKEFSFGGKRFQLQLARRYLAHPEDERLHWSLEALRSQIMVQLPPLITDSAVWSHILDYWDPHDGWTPDEWKKHPWRSLALHEEKWQQPVLREECVGKLLKCSTTGLLTNLCGPTLPLLMPLAGSETVFRLRLRGNFRPTTITWENQCWGCGGPGVQDRLKYAIMEYTSEEPNTSYSWGEYCSRQCVRRAIPEIARCSSAWTARNRGSGLFLAGTSVHEDEEFWDCLGPSEKEALRAVGWQSDMGWGAGDWILEPPNHDSDDDDDDDDDDYDDEYEGGYFYG